MPLDIVWTPAALTRLREIRSYVAADRPDAAERLAIRIVAVVQALHHHPFLGRVSASHGLRELVIGGTPYIVVYRASRIRVTILTIRHASRQG